MAKGIRGLALTVFTGFLLPTAIAALAPSAAWAELPLVWYTKLGIGWSYPDDLDISKLPATAEFDLGMPLFSGALGAALGNDWRLEVEVARLRNELEVLYFPQTGIAVDPDHTDALEADTVSLNVIRDFRLGMALRPYLGLGIGTTHAKLGIQETRIQGQYFTLPPRTIVDDDDRAFAYQIIAGFTAPFAKRWELGVEYRFWQAPSLKFTDEEDQRLDLQHSVHSSWLQLGYRFTDRTGRQSRTRTPGAGWYLSGAGGMTYAVDAEIEGSLANFDAFGPGPVILLAAGYDTGHSWRYEFEFAHRENDVEIVDFNPELGERRSTGEISADSVMLNAIREFNSQSSIRPFLGVGLGVVAASYDVRVPAGEFVDDETTGVALQIIAGLDITLTPRLSFTADYRAWITDRMKYELSNGEDVKSFHLVHSTSLGLRYSFDS